MATVFVVMLNNGLQYDDYNAWCSGVFTSFSLAMYHGVMSATEEAWHFTVEEHKIDDDDGRYYEVSRSAEGVWKGNGFTMTKKGDQNVI